MKGVYFHKAYREWCGGSGSKMEANDDAIVLIKRKMIGCCGGCRQKRNGIVCMRARTREEGVKIFVERRRGE